jgi:hypothetical protein
LSKEIFQKNAQGSRKREEEEEEDEEGRNSEEGNSQVSAKLKKAWNG